MRLLSPGRAEYRGIGLASTRELNKVTDLVANPENKPRVKQSLDYHVLVHNAETVLVRCASV